MEPPNKDQTLDSLNWGNNSFTNTNAASDTTNFRSVEGMQHHNNMELSSLEVQSPSPRSPILVSPTIEARKTSKKDSVFSETSSLRNSPSSSRRTSTSTSTSRRDSPSKSKRRTYQSTINTYSSRPLTKRAIASSPHTAQINPLYSFHSHRPSLNSRRTIPYLPSTPPNNSSNQYFYFPSLPAPDSSPQPHSQTPPIPQQPPPTVQYWTSDSTRRLEYAAIDAAGRGLRGFFTKLIPDCMLPNDMRRTRFCEGDEGSDAGSVRRYRLELPGEIEDNQNKTGMEEKRSGVFRRWSGSLRSKTA